jgi:hypothetical protein
VAQANVAWFELSQSTGYAARMDQPIVCTLTKSELRERRRTLLDAMKQATVDVAPMPGGYCYRFEPRSEVLMQLSRLVDLERQCCRFLTYRIVVEAGEQPIQLEITGPPEATSMVADLFGR